MEIDMFVEIHDLLANRTAAVEVYLGAKAQFDKAETTLKGAKKDVVDIVNGYGFIEGNTADLEIALQSRTTINEKALLALGLTQAQIDSCKVEGIAFPVVRIKAKKVRKAA
jgi:hypothetical protein